MKRLFSTVDSMICDLNLKKIIKILALGIGSLAITFSILGSPSQSQNTCLDLDSRTGVGTINGMLRRIRPQLHLNQVDAAAVARNAREIYLPGDNWASLNVDGTTRRFALNDFPPYRRVRRAHYLQDFNSSRILALPAQDGVRLRIEFETDGTEIKGWCTGCLAGNRDARAADANIIPQPGETAPFIEVLINAEIRNQRVTRFELRDVQSSMSVDARGFLSLFEGAIGSNIRSRASSAVEQAWSQFSPEIIAAIESELGRGPINDLRFEGDRAIICTR